MKNKHTKKKKKQKKKTKQKKNKKNRQLTPKNLRLILRELKKPTMQGTTLSIDKWTDNLS